ncbi:MAG: hypothetical protein KJP07_01975, partial [Desulfatitalea sp.]|nr:hypothetical protein [Desulfatitalea sp.]
VTVGAVTGGIGAELAGGSFADGAFQGAWTSAFALIFNETLDTLEKIASKLNRVRRYPVNDELTDSYNQAFEVLKENVEDAYNRARAEHATKSIVQIFGDISIGDVFNVGADLLSVQEGLDKEIKLSIMAYECELSYIDMIHDE